MIDDFYTTEFTVTRNEIDEDEYGYYSDSTQVGTFYGHLQQATQEMIERFGMNYQTAYAIWCSTDTDVKIGDTLEDDTRTYTVSAIQTNDLGNNPHLKLAVEGGDTIES
jgi:hypothetical protein